MEDFDEAEEMNEEDLIELGDAFADINLKVSSITINSIPLEPRARDAQ